MIRAHSRSERPRTYGGLGRKVAVAYLALVVLVTVFPFYWMLRTALSNNVDLLQDTASPWPVGLTLGAFERVLGLASRSDALAQGGSGVEVDIGRSLLNSVIYAGVTTAAVVFFSLLAAYAFSRLRWPGRDAAFGVVLTSLMIPGVLTLLPNFVLIHQLGLLNTFGGMILPGALFSAFNIFFLRQFMLGLPTEIDEAARMDGASAFGVLFRITVPMTSGPLTTLSVLGFITMWNDYFWPLLVTTDETVRPLTVALAAFQQASPQSQPDWAGLMAATLVAALPMMLVFVVFGRRIVDSIGFTGLR